MVSTFGIRERKKPKQKAHPSLRRRCLTDCGSTPHISIGVYKWETKEQTNHTFLVFIFAKLSSAWEDTRLFLPADALGI